MIWGSNPSYRLTVGATVYTDEAAISLMVKRPENNISYMVATVDDYRSSRFIGVFDAFTAISLALRYGTGAWTTVFSGRISSASPKLSTEGGEVLEVSAWGEGNVVAKTHCDTSYGTESQHTGLTTIKQIVDDLITNYINKEFDGAATTHTITSLVENAHPAFNITHLASPYDSNFTVINKACDLVNAYAQYPLTGLTSVHWYVDPLKNLRLKRMDADSTDGLWTRWYGGNQAAATIVVGTDMILYDFRKNTEDYANQIVFCSGFRKPGWDYWTETSAASWVNEANMAFLDDSGAGLFKVGANSLRFRATASMLAYGTYPAIAANWDLGIIGSQDTVPIISFYARRTANANHSVAIQLRTTNSANFFQETLFNTATDVTWMPNALEWYHITIPLDTAGEYTGWWIWGAPSWNNIDFIAVMINNAGYAGTTDFWLDDLHFSGKIVREAFNSTERTAHGTYQRVIRSDMAVDDSTIAATDTGTAARLAYAELIRRQQTPTVGLIKIPLLIGALPGHQFYVQAAQQSTGVYRIEKPMRAKSITHFIDAQGFFTTLDLTDDLYNTHAAGVPDTMSLLLEYAGALGNSEARDLKNAGMDRLMTRLAVDYP